jgi:hypothetical protein
VGAGQVAAIAAAPAGNRQPIHEQRIRAQLREKTSGTHIIRTFTGAGLCAASACAAAGMGSTVDGPHLDKRSRWRADGFSILWSPINHTNSG